MADDGEFSDLRGGADRLAGEVDDLDIRLRDLDRTASAFARTMTQAFAASAIGARSFDDILKSVFLRFSEISVRHAFRPIENALSSAFAGLFGGGVAAATGAIKPFAAGGIIGTPTYFPLAQGGLGLAGEAGPEAIVPLSRGSDGRLGVAMAGASGPATIVVNIATPDTESFRRSEAYVTGPIARAVARGQRGL